MSGAALPNPGALPLSAPRVLRTPSSRSHPARRLTRRAAFALAGTVLAFAAAHVAILIAHAALHGDARALDLFSLLEAPRLWPALAGARWTPVSAVLAVSVFALMFAGPARGLAIVRIRGRARVPLPSGPCGGAPAPERNGHVSRPRPPAPRRVSMTAGWLALAAGLAIHMLLLAAIEPLVPAFPSVPDVVHERLPYVDFGVPGEMAFFAFMAAIVAWLFRRQREAVPEVLLRLGVFYAVRGLFLFLLPIGPPPTAPPVGERFVLWPFPGHAYFPGGHTGMMTVLSLSLISPAARRWFLAATFVFTFGTLLARTHYAADALGGALLGWGIVTGARARDLERSSVRIDRDPARRPAVRLRRMREVS